MYRYVAAALITILLAACQTTSAGPGAAHNDAADGLTANTAIRLDAKNTSEGIAAERRWIQHNYPGAKVKSQSLLMTPRPMDQIEIELPSGESRDLYFDISSFFGKM